MRAVGPEGGGAGDETHAAPTSPRRPAISRRVIAAAGNRLSIPANKVRPLWIWMRAPVESERSSVQFFKTGSRSEKWPGFEISTPWTNQIAAFRSRCRASPPRRANRVSRPPRPAARSRADATPRGGAPGAPGERKQQIPPNDGVYGVLPRGHPHRRGVASRDLGQVSTRDAMQRLRGDGRGAGEQGARVPLRQDRRTERAQARAHAQRHRAYPPPAACLPRTARAVPRVARPALPPRPGRRLLSFSPRRPSSAPTTTPARPRAHRNLPPRARPGPLTPARLLFSARIIRTPRSAAA